MSQKRVEDRLQKALGDYASNLDEDQLWSDIEDRVPKQKKKKRRLWIWFFFGFCVIAFMLLGVQWIGGEEAENIALDEHPITSSEDVKISNVDLSQDGYFEQVKSNNDTTSKSYGISVSKDINDLERRLQSDSELNNIGNEHNLSNRIITNTDESHNIPKDNNTTNIKPHEELDREVMNISILPSLVIANIIQKRKIKLTLNSIIKRPKRKKKIFNPRPFVSLNYYAGKAFDARKNVSSEHRYINLGDAYFSQGLSISYNHFLTQRVYGKINFAADKNYKKYSDKIARDTTVESSLGSQILEYNEYSNGVVDTESGIPIVSAVYNRDVLNLNDVTTISVGLGVGYLQPIGNWNVNFEIDFQRSLYYDLSGLGRDDSGLRIQNLKSFDNYFAFGPKYTLNTKIGTEFKLNKTISIAGGIQYQKGLSSILLKSTMHEEKLNLLRGVVGLKANL